MSEIDELPGDKAYDTNAVREMLAEMGIEVTVPSKSNPESTEAMGRGVDTRDDGQGKANVASPIPIDGDEGGVR